LLFLEKKIKPVVISSEKTKHLIISSVKNEVPYYFLRKKLSSSLFLKNKIKRLIISPKKNVFF